jgi:fatty-acyl-CoA synthase
VHGADDTALLGETIGEAFRRSVARHGSVEALVSRHQGLRYTYRELAELVDHAARGLMACGIERGDRVGIWSPNCAEWVVVQFATARIGAILVNVNPAYRQHELEYALGQSGLKMLVTAPGFRSHDYRATLDAILPELASAAPGELRAERLPELRSIVLLGGGGAPGMLPWDDLLERAAAVEPAALEARAAGLQFDDPINIQYTSGTTGRPKGATLSHHNILNNGFFVGERMRLTSADRLCIPVPLYHCFGMVLGNLACVTHGATMVYPGEAFDPLAVLETIQAERCTAVHGVPTMFIAELDHPEFARFDLSTLRTGIMAGSPCPVEVMKRVNTQMHMTEVEICYGMTETSPVSFQTLPDDDEERRVATVGSVHPHVEAKVVDPSSGAVVPRGTPGELLTRGYLVMLGYWGNDEATREAIDAARWMHTGDLAVMRPDGYVNIVGRIKDMIIRGGENVYPREIEEFLYGHPKIADVQVIGVPDARYGEEIMAWVRLKEGESADAEEIRAYARGRIATYKIPRYVKFVDAFPMTVTGKIQKFKMREQAIEELGLAQAAAVTTA